MSQASQNYKRLVFALFGKEKSRMLIFCLFAELHVGESDNVQLIAIGGFSKDNAVYVIRTLKYAEIFRC